MKILKIEIDGFKSYGSYQSLEKLDSEFNAITGLNGSGKSNVLDSICFLLGISNLTWIRAQNNEDLVFKKGQGGVTKATVSITFDNTDPKHKPIGFEDQDILVIKKQIVLNGKVTYHINNVMANQTKVQNLFNTCAMNVNNPHFLIMQGRVTKVLNMTPRQVLYMVEEAAGVRVYESKRKSAVMTLEKKEEKIKEINRMMDEELKPRVNKLKAEKELYDEFMRLGSDSEHLQHLKHCIDYYTCEKVANRCKNKIEEKMKEQETRGESIREMNHQIEEFNGQVQEMTNKLNELGEERDHLKRETEQRGSGKVKAATEKSTKEEEIDDVKKNIALGQQNNKTDQDRLTKKKQDLDKMQNSHGGEAKLLEEAEQTREKCKAMLNALDKGMTVDSEGNTASLDQIIIERNSQLNRNKTELERAQINLRELRPLFVTRKKDLITLAPQTNLQREKHQLVAQIKEIDDKIGASNFNPEEHKSIMQSREQLSNRKVALTDKNSNFEARFSWLNFRPPRQSNAHFDQSSVLGVLARLVTLKDPNHAMAVETAMGGAIQNVVVRTRETAKQLLKSGLERRVTFIPLDDIQARTLQDRQYERAVQLVGKENVFKATDLVNYDPQIRRAVDFALGSTLICADMESARKVCFDREVMCRVVTFDGEDFNPHGVISGGSQGNRGHILRELHEFYARKDQVLEIDEEIKKIELFNQQFARARHENNELKNKRQTCTQRLEEIDIDLQMDPYTKCEEEIATLGKVVHALTITTLLQKISENEDVVNELQPEVKRLQAQLDDLNDKKKNEKKFREEERKKAENQLRLAEQTLKNMAGAAEERRRKLDLLRLDVETTEKALEEQQIEVENLQAKLDALEKDLATLAEALQACESVVKESDAALKAKQHEYRQQEKRIKEKEQEIEEMKKSVRQHQQAGESFQKDIGEEKAKKREAEGRASKLMSIHSWLADEKEHFNKPGTDYDFRNRTVETVTREIENIKTRRKELEQRVNMNAMKNLAEQNEIVNNLDAKRANLMAERERLNEMIVEIDAEKERELYAAFEKISKDFGGIFSTLLPGTGAKLLAVDPNDLEQGLQVKIAFNNVWKESLDELSGGQRSLVALSLILAMLKCNPAPIYILDEVDAALDMSHTANIGTMIKQHFKESQFIVVSLKEGMFSNANVIYRTQFINGTSTIRRTENK